MRIPYSFFEDEVRDGFFIPSYIKHGWAAQLIIFEEIERICKKYNLRIFADCGSLLGAVRHKGFIPWDDDFDTAMLRDELMIFNEAAEKELKPPFHLVTIHTDENDSEFTTYVCTDDFAPLDTENLERFYGFPVRTGVDIFPLDYISHDTAFEEERKKLIFELNWLEERVKDREGILANEENLRAVESKYNIKINRNGNVFNQLIILEEKLAMLVPPENSEEVVLLPYWVGHGNHVHNKHWFDESFRMPFEFTSVPVPKGYDNVLNVEYGDYMKIYRNGGKHNYPAFSNRLHSWEEKYGVKEYEIPREPFMRQKQSKRPYSEEISFADAVNKIAAGKNVSNGDALDSDALNTAAAGSYFFPYRKDGTEKLFPFIFDALDAGREVHIVPLDISYKDFSGNIIETQKTDITIDDFLKDIIKYFGENYLKGSPADSLEDIKNKFPLEYLEDNKNKSSEDSLEDALKKIFETNIIFHDEESFNIEHLNAQEIFIQFPYDDTNPSWTINKKIFAENLAHHTGKLIYVPAFTLRDFSPEDFKEMKNLKYVSEVPAVYYSDEIIVHSEQMKEMLAAYLAQRTGEENLMHYFNKIIVH